MLSDKAWVTARSHFIPEVLDKVEFGASFHTKLEKTFLYANFVCRGVLIT